MKKIILGAAAATLIASPILAAAPANAAQWNGHATSQHNRGDRHDSGRNYGRHTTTYRTSYRAPTRATYQQTYRPNYRSWNRGDRFDSRYASNYRVVSNYRDYGLQAPPYGYQWEQSGNDAVLVALAGGLIGAVIGGALN
ncbi:MAG: RcnB family protein [Sphingomonas sp.]